MGFIEFIKYVLLGIIQGFTEVLPVSSSGHVELFKVLLDVDVDANLLFQIVVNTGSLVTFLVIFAKDIVRLVADFFVFLFSPSARDRTRAGFEFAIKLAIASVPAAVVGILFKDAIDQALSRYGTLLSGIGLLLTATILLLTSSIRIHRRPTELSFADAVLIGTAQAFALIPGLSRSGTTTATALRRGIGLETALRFSFMMYIPVSLGSLALALMGFIEEPNVVLDFATTSGYAVAFAASAVATFIAYRIVFNAFKSGRLRLFSTWCFVAGFVSIVLFIIR